MRSLPGGRLVVVVGAILVAGFYAWLASGRGFLYDDRQLVRDEVTLRSPSDVVSVLTEPYYGDLPYYRPLTRLSYAAQRTLSGAVPLPFLVANAALAGALVLLAYGLLRRSRFALARGPALTAAILFAVHPLAASCVLPVAGRDTLIPIALILGALTCWIADTRGSRILSYALLAAALLAKELAVAAPLLLLAADATSATPPRGVRAWLARHAPSAALLAGYFGLRHVVLADAAPLTLARSVRLPLATIAFAAQSIVTPSLSLAYQPAIATWWSPSRLSFAVGAIGSIAYLASRNERPGSPRNVLFWLTLFLLLQVPVANLFRQETRFDERYAFPSALGAIALGAVVASASLGRSRARAAWTTLAVLLIGVCCAMDVSRSAGFASELSFSEAWTHTSADSPDAWNSHGVALLDAGRKDEGERALRRAITLNPHHAQAANNLGTVLLERGVIEDAATLLETAVAGSPSYATARYNLANARARAGRGVEAEALFREAVRLRPRYPQAWNNLGALLVGSGRNDDALAAFERVVAIDPAHAKAHVNRGVLLARRGRLREAIDAYRAALAIEPSNADAHYDLAAAALAVGDRDTALRAAEEALRLRPEWPEAVALRKRAAP